MPTQPEFLTKMFPFAETVCKQLGANTYPAAAVILAQWDVESGREADSWIGHNNYAGIRMASGAFVQYDTPGDFVADYVSTLLTTWQGSAYAGLVAVMRNSSDPQEIVTALANSPWDEGHYGETEGLARGELLRQRLPFYLEALKPTEQMPPPAPDLPDAWAQQAVNWAISHGISDGSDPHRPATRQEIMVMLYRYSGGKV